MARQRQAAHRRKVERQVGVQQLHQSLRLGEILELISPQVGQRQRRRQTAMDRIDRLVRHQHLATVCRRCNAGGLVHGQCDVVVAIRLGQAGVHADPNAQRRTIWPGLGQQRPLDVDAGQHRQQGVGKGAKAGVALVTKHDANVTRHRFGDDRALPHHQRRTGFAEVAHQGRRSFDVGHHKRDPAARQVVLQTHIDGPRPQSPPV